MTLTNKLKNAGFWQTLQVVIQVVSQFGYIAFMARLLSKADFGLMALASSFIAIGTIFSEGGMGAALIQRKNITQKHMNAALQGGILIGLSIFIIFFFTAKYIATFFDQPQLELLIKVIGVNVVLHSVSGISMMLMQKRFKFKHTATITMGASVIGYTAGILLAYDNWGVWSLVAAAITTTTLNAIGFFYLAPVKLTLKFHTKEWKELFSFGFGIILLKINNYLGNQGLNLVLGKIFTPGMLGVFERTYKIKTLPSTYLGNVLDTIMFPAMSEIQDENERLFRVYQHSLGVVNSVLLPVAVFLIFFSKEVVLILLGPNWLEAVLPLQIMFIVLPFSSSGRMADSVIRAKGLVYQNAVRKFIYVVFLITSISIGAYFYGIVGAAIAVTASYFFNYTLMLFLVRRIFNKSMHEIFLKPILSGVYLLGIVLAFVILFTTILNNWEHTSILNFVIITMLIGLIMAVIAWKKPSLLGSYLHDSIKKIFSK